MDFGKVNRIFDPDCELTDQMSKLIEEDNEEGRDMRATVNRFIQKHMTVNPAEALKLESAINGLVILSGCAYEALGVVLGRSFDVSEPEALQEIEELSREIKDGGFLPYWTKNDNGCHPSVKIELAAMR